MPRNDQGPLYLRLRAALVAIILDDDHSDGDLLPSVRSFAAEQMANPLTVAKAYQTLLQDGVVIARRGIGFVVAKGGIQRLRDLERKRFLEEEWPRLTDEIRRLELGFADLFQKEGSGGS